MRKLLLVAALIALCALLEVPQDYEGTKDARTDCNTCRTCCGEKPCECWIPGSHAHA